MYLNYDVPFIFSEVNGDRVMWKVKKDGEMEVISINTHSVGKCISTKSVGTNYRNDLTLQYKYPESRFWYFIQRPFLGLRLCYVCPYILLNAKLIKSLNIDSFKD